jgi:hypothetical protein
MTYRVAPVLLLVAALTSALVGIDASGASATVGGDPDVPAWVAFSRTDATGTHIYKVWMDGTGLTHLTDRKAADTDPAFSPDASRILFTRTTRAGSDLWEMDADGSDQHLLIPDASQAAWNWKGDHFAYVRTYGGTSDIWTAKANGWGRARLTRDPGADTSPAWLDGSGIAFVSDRFHRPQVFLMRRGGSHQHRVAPQHAVQGSPAWLSDGLAFVSDEGGTNDLWHVSLPGREAEPLQQTTADESQLAVGGGIELAYVEAGPGGTAHLNVADVQNYAHGDPALQITSASDAVDSDPDWVGARAWIRAFDAQFKENLEAVANTARSIGAGTDSYADVTDVAMAEALPELMYVSSDTASTGPLVVSIAPRSVSWAAAALSRSGVRFEIQVYYRPENTYGAMPITQCDGNHAGGAFATAWPF